MQQRQPPKQSLRKQTLVAINTQDLNSAVACQLLAGGKKCLLVYLLWRTVFCVSKIRVTTYLL